MKTVVKQEDGDMFIGMRMTRKELKAIVNGDLERFSKRTNDKDMPKLVRLGTDKATGQPVAHFRWPDGRTDVQVVSVCGEATRAVPGQLLGSPGRAGKADGGPKRRGKAKGGRK